MKKKEKTGNNIKRTFKILKRTAFCLIVLTLLTAVVCNTVVISSADSYTLTLSEAQALKDIDCIIVLGAGINVDGSMSAVLTERVVAGVKLYSSGVSSRILVSGDHSRADYNEVGAMKDYMVSEGVPASAVFTDHAGFDTYDTMYRARDIFKAKRVLIVTQGFHLSRAVFIARSLGLDAFGYACDGEGVFAGFRNEIREAAARTKYVFDAIIKPSPKYLGEAIPIWGDSSASDG